MRSFVVVLLLIGELLATAVGVLVLVAAGPAVAVLRGLGQIIVRQDGW